MTASRNSQWMVTVRRMLRQGWGVEDIAVRLKCHPNNVRAEVEIYRKEGRLREILGLE